MKKLIYVIFLFAVAVAWAADPPASKQYYSYPTTGTLRDADRLLVYKNNSGSRNITGAALKSQINTEPVIRGKLIIRPIAP